MNNLSSNFQLESLNLDIESYSKEELMQILKIPNEYNKDQIAKNKNILQDKINKLSLDNSKKYSYSLFLDNAEKKLLNYFLNNVESEEEFRCKSLSNMDLKNNIISNYDNNFIIENKSIVHNSLNNISVDAYNKNRSIKHVSINSIFASKQNVSGELLSNHGAQFTINLPETINNVISMRISSINIPIFSIFNISEELGNTSFKINNTTIKLEDGFYSFTNDISNTNSIIVQLNKQLKNYLSNNNDLSNSQFTLNPINNKITLTITNKIDVSINFNIENDSTPLKLTLGWLLGFRKSNYNNYSTVSTFTADAPITNKSREFYIAINDFQNNTINKFNSAFSESLLPPNIITKICFKDEYNFKMEERVDEIVDRTRYYDGPTQINKLLFTIYDEYGRIVNLNYNDWSCVLTFEHYNAIKN